MLDLAALGSCSEITSAHAKQAASSSSEMRTLLERVATIARPGEGCPKVLTAIAYLSGQDWVDGRLHVELSGTDDETTLTIMAEYGVGIRERILPVARFAVPYDEFARALELAPALVLPLRIREEGNMIILQPLLTPEDPINSVAPAFELDDASLGEDLRKTAPPPPVAEHLRESMGEIPDTPTRPNHTIIADRDD